MNYRYDLRYTGAIGLKVLIALNWQVGRLEGLLEKHGGVVVSGGGVSRASKYVAPTIVKVSLDSPLMQVYPFYTLIFSLRRAPAGNPPAG